MDWPRLLSSYPKKLFEDALPVTLLGIMERAGLLEEAELIRLADEDETAVRQVLFDLRMNNLIEYGSKYVRTTDRGRFILNRFDVEHLILDEALDSASVRDDERDSFKKALLVYRDSSYTRYLDSVSVLNTWKGLSNEINELSTVAEALALGTQALLARDIGHWWRLVETSDVASGFASEVRVACSHISSLPGRWSRGLSGSALLKDFSRGLSWEIDHSEFNRLHGETGPLIGVLVSLDSFRCHHEPNHWFDAFPDTLADLTSGISAGHLADSLNGLIPEAKPNALEIYFRDSFAELMERMEDSIRQLHSPGAISRYEGIDIADSLEEYCQLTRLSRDEARSTLAETERKCKDLLVSAERMLFETRSEPEVSEAISDTAEPSGSSGQPSPAR